MNNEVNNVQDVNSALNINNENVVQQSVAPQENNVQNNVEPPKKKRKGKNILIIVLIFALLGCIVYILFDKKIIFNNNTNNIDENNVIENNSDESNNQKNENNTNDLNIYGFAYVYKNFDIKEYKIMALNSQGDDIELNSGIGNITFYIKNNRLLFTNRRSNYEEPSYIQKAYYIDLNVHPYKVVQLTENVSFYDNFDISSKYLFAKVSPKDGMGIKRYNLETKEETIFEKDIIPIEIFVYKDRIYYQTIDYTKDNPVDHFYSLDFDGNNKNEISEVKYNQVISAIGYKDEVGNDATYQNEPYILKNGMKVTITDGKMMLGDNLIYTVSNSHNMLIFNYSSKNNVISFEEFTPTQGEELPSKYFNYYIDTAKLDRVDEISVMDFRSILIK